MLSYPDANDRGLYLGIWSAMRNSGSIIGGAINFSTNYSDSSAGGISWSTYLIFVGFGGYLYSKMLEEISNQNTRLHRNSLRSSLDKDKPCPSQQRHQGSFVPDCVLEGRVLGIVEACSTKEGRRCNTQGKHSTNQCRRRGSFSFPLSIPSSTEGLWAPIFLFTFQSEHAHCPVLSLVSQIIPMS